MPEPLIEFSDLELFLTDWYREALAARSEPEADNVTVDSEEPAEDSVDFPERLVILRDDGGPDTWFLTGERSVGVSILASSLPVARALARIVHGMRTQMVLVEDGNPVTAVFSSTSPVRVAEAQPRFRFYFSMTLGVIGVEPA